MIEIIISQSDQISTLFLSYILKIQMAHLSSMPADIPESFSKSNCNKQD